MRLEVSPRVAAATIRRPATRVSADYAPYVRQQEERRRRREAVWATLSFVALLVFWDVSARLDRPSLDAEVAVTAARTR
jgi:hypothetical protein